MIIVFKILSAGRRQELGRTSAGKNCIICRRLSEKKHLNFLGRTSAGKKFLPTSFRGFFFLRGKKIALPKTIKNSLTSNFLIILGSKSPPVSTPFLPGREKKSEVNTKSCFNFAKNCEASSLWVGAHRYTRISCASKLLWV